MDHSADIFAEHLRLTGNAPRTAAFSLVELLVVIGIITILIAILLPVVSLTQQQGQSTRCLSNLHQIGLSISSYANAHDFCLVPGDYFGVGDGYSQKGGGSWCDILADEGYLNVPIGHIAFIGDNLANFGALWNQDNILFCPTCQDANVLLYWYPTTQTDGTGMMWFSRASDTTLEAVRTTYAINTAPAQEAQGLRPLPFSFLPDYPTTDHPDWRINKLSQFTDDTTLPLVFDGVWMFNNDPARISARHYNKTETNLLFADFHCETQLAASQPNDNWYLK
jgi:prepilin-type processing-associated H-X9-DG protein